MLGGSSRAPAQRIKLIRMNTAGDLALTSTKVTEPYGVAVGN